MIHQPVRGASAGKYKAKEAWIQAEEIDKSRLRLAQVLAECTGRPLAEIEALMDHDHYMDAPETKELGLVDSIAGKGHFLSASAAAAKEPPPPPAAAAPPASE